MQLHEEIIWNVKLLASEKGENIEAKLNEISNDAWFEAIRKCTGKSIQIIRKK